MTSSPADELTSVCTGATALMPSSSAILSRSEMGIVLEFKASSRDEFGGCNQMSAPTPSVRFPVSFEIPLVRPTTTNIKMTSSATAKMLTVVRTGRAFRPAMIICLFIPVYHLLPNLQELGSFGPRQIKYLRI